MFPLLSSISELLDMWCHHFSTHCWHLPSWPLWSLTGPSQLCILTFVQMLTKYEQNINVSLYCYSLLYFFILQKQKRCITVKLNDHLQYINYLINPSIKHSVHHIYITSLLLNAVATFPLYWLSFLLYFLFVTYFHKCTKLMQKSHDCDLFKYILPLLTQSPWLLWPVSCPHLMSRFTRCLTRLIATTHERPATPRYTFKCHCHDIWTDWR